EPIDRAMPTTVTVGLPGAPGKDSLSPTENGAPPAASTISPGAVAHRPAVRTSWSTSPPASARPAIVIGGRSRPGSNWNGASGSGLTETVPGRSDTVAN